MTKPPSRKLNPMNQGIETAVSRTSEWNVVAYRHAFGGLLYGIAIGDGKIWVNQNEADVQQLVDIHNDSLKSASATSLAQQSSESDSASGASNLNPPSPSPSPAWIEKNKNQYEKPQPSSASPENEGIETTN